MIEREFIKGKMREFQVSEFITQKLRDAGLSSVKIQRTPLGDKIIVTAARPGLVVGRKGENIKAITKTLKKRFKLEHPEIEIAEVDKLNLDANIVAQRIASSLERFGPAKFKSIGHRSMGDVMTAGAFGIEILISGKIPGSRARRWRFYQGYLKKCGDLAISGVSHAYSRALLKTGVVGIQVKIMPPDLVLPDKIVLLAEEITEVEEITEEKEETEKKSEEKKKEESAKKEKKKAKETVEEEKEEQPKKEEGSPKEAPKEEPKEEAKEEAKE